MTVGGISPGEAVSSPARSHRLSLNESPYPPLPSVLRALRAEAGGANRYPEADGATLRAALGERLGVPADHVMLGAGSIGVLAQLLAAACAPGAEVLHAWRSFEAYPMVAELAGGVPVTVPLDGRHAHDLDVMAKSLSERTGAVLLCNPNNPTGTVFDRAPLDRFLDQVPPHVPVVLDEAYREFVTDAAFPDGVDAYRRRENVVVLRTFSKAWGLAGLRVGYAVAHPAVLDRARRRALPFQVNRLAVAAALASLDAEDELRARIAVLVEQREELWAGLRALEVATPPSEANFLWLPLGERSGDFAARCAAAGLAVTAHPEEGVRVTVGVPEANRAVLEVARGFVSQDSRSVVTQSN
jgi:histidinol-phosphate aminotransferase